MPRTEWMDGGEAMRRGATGGLLGHGAGLVSGQQPIQSAVPTGACTRADTALARPCSDIQPVVQGEGDPSSVTVASPSGLTATAH